MAKAKKSRVKKAKQSTQLPLDDMRWRPVPEIFERLSRHIGNKTLTAQDLTKAMASDKIPCKRRYTNEHTLKIEKFSDAELDAIANKKVDAGHHQPAAHGQLLPASFWIDHYLEYSSNGDIRVAFRLPPTHHGPSEPSFTFTANWAFYLWEPDCVKVWPALAPQPVAVREAEAGKPLGRKPGPRPKKEWQLFIAHKLYILKEAGKQTPTAGELADYCRHELGYMPDESAINLWLRELGRLLG